MSKKNTKQKIFEAYQNYWLEEGKDPATVYKFCKQLKISEKEFYDHYNNFTSIRHQFWANLIQDTKSELESSETYKDYSSREKWLSFYFSFFEKLTAQRSFALSIWPQKMSAQSFKHLKGLKQAFSDLSEDWLIQAENEGMIMKTDYLSEVRQEMVWWQFLFMVHFWSKDESLGFERTDAAIEKSIHLLFELFGNELAESMVDFAKFLVPEAPNPFDFWSKLKTKL